MNNPQEREGEKKLGEIPGDENAVKLVPGFGKNAERAALFYKILIGLHIAASLFLTGADFVLAGTGVVLVGPITLGLGIMALIEIKKSKGALRSNHFIVSAIVMPVLICLVLFLFPGFPFIF